MPVSLPPPPVMRSMFFGSGRYDSRIEIRNTPVGMIHSAQAPQNIAWPYIVRIGASAMKMMPNTSVMMPRIDGAIITPIVTSAAFRLSPRCLSTS